jgi:hypothetical protein
VLAILSARFMLGSLLFFSLVLVWLTVNFCYLDFKCIVVSEYYSLWLENSFTGVKFYIKAALTLNRSLVIEIRENIIISFFEVKI